MPLPMEKKAVPLTRSTFHPESEGKRIVSTSLTSLQRCHLIKWDLRRAKSRNKEEN
jgi:hypothetical protein